MTERSRFALQGELSTFRPEIVLQFLGWASVTGVLVARRSRPLLHICFDRGHVVYASLGPTLVDFATELLQAGLVARPQYEAAVSASTGGAATAVVKHLRRSLANADVDAFVEKKTMDTVTRFLSLRQERFSFQEGSGCEGLEGTTWRGDVDHLLLECLTRLERERRDDDAVPGA